MSMAASQLRSDPQRLFVVMGVAGCGKSTIGAKVAEAVSGTYLDGDDLHPAENISKMRAGIPLTDDDRWPWLRCVGRQLADRAGIVLIGCSALRKSYRELITESAGSPVQFIFLDGTQDLIAERMSLRTGHFMPTDLLQSQFETLERPDDSENAVSVNVGLPMDNLVANIAEHIQSISS